MAALAAAGEPGPVDSAPCRDLSGAVACLIWCLCCSLSRSSCCLPWWSGGWNGCERGEPCWSRSRCPAHRVLGGRVAVPGEVLDEHDDRGHRLRRGAGGRLGVGLWAAGGLHAPGLHEPEPLAGGAGCLPPGGGGPGRRAAVGHLPAQRAGLLTCRRAFSLCVPAVAEPSVVEPRLPGDGTGSGVQHGVEFRDEHQLAVLLR